jgi:hypothetical protein
MLRIQVSPEQRFDCTKHRSEIDSRVVCSTVRDADSGGEFQGEFEKLFQQLKIKHIATNRCNPCVSHITDQNSPTNYPFRPDTVPALPSGNRRPDIH